MQDQIIIGIVVVVALVAHLWLYLWVKFKMDEGSILKCLEGSSPQELISSEAIAASTNFSIHRISKVCRKSKTIEQNPQHEGWFLNKP